jgi:hypothetical protein
MDKSRSLIMVDRVGRFADWYVVGYRTPIFPYRRDDPPQGFTSAILETLFHATASFAGIARIRNLLFGNTLNPALLRSDHVIRLLEGKDGLRDAIPMANIVYVDCACNSALAALLLLGPPPSYEEIDVYIGFEDLAVSHETLTGIVVEWPGFDHLGDMCRYISVKYGITLDNARAYIHAQAQLVAKGVPDHILPISLDGRTVATDAFDAGRTVEKSKSAEDLGRPPYVSRFARGGTVLISTRDPDLAASHRGLEIKAAHCLSAGKRYADPGFIVECVSAALANAGVRWPQVRFLELYDGCLTLTLASIKQLEAHVASSLMSRVNLLGNAIIRGNPVAAIGGLMISNAETLLYNTFPSEDAHAVIIGYSAGTAIAMVVTACQ